MRTQTAINKLQQFGFKVVATQHRKSDNLDVGWIATHPISDYEITLHRNGSQDIVTHFYVKHKDRQDDPRSDYFAGQFYYRVMQAINAAFYDLKRVCSKPQPQGSEL